MGRASRTKAIHGTCCEAHRYQAEGSCQADEGETNSGVEGDQGARDGGCGHASVVSYDAPAMMRTVFAQTTSPTRKQYLRDHPNERERRREEQLKQQSAKNIKRACVRALLKVIRRTNTCVNIDFLYNK